MGLVIQPLLVALLAPLVPAQLADGTTLFNFGQRLGGATGVSLLSTLLALRVADRMRAALAPLGMPGVRVRTGGIGDLATAPAALHARLTQAAILGFHDTVLAVIAVMVAALISAIFLNQPPDRQDAPPPTSLKDPPHQPGGPGPDQNRRSRWPKNRTRQCHQSGTTERQEILAATRRSPTSGAMRASMHVTGRPHGTAALRAAAARAPTTLCDRRRTGPQTHSPAQREVCRVQCVMRAGGWPA